MASDNHAAQPNSTVRQEVRHTLVALAVMLLMVGVVFLFNVPNPNMLLITGLAVFTSLYGFPAGIACAVVLESPLPMHTDGESCGSHTEFTMRCIQRKLWYQCHLRAERRWRADHQRHGSNEKL